MSQHMEYGESRYLKENEWKLSFFCVRRMCLVQCQVKTSMCRFVRNTEILMSMG